MNEKAPNNRPAAVPPDVAKLSFEEAMSELEKLVRQLEEGKAKLDDAIGAYERGALLKRHCEAKLSEAKAKIERITFGGAGKGAVAPFNSRNFLYLNPPQTIMPSVSPNLAAAMAETAKAVGET